MAPTRAEKSIFLFSGPERWSWQFDALSFRRMLPWHSGVLLPMVWMAPVALPVASSPRTGTITTAVVALDIVMINTCQHARECCVFEVAVVALSNAVVLFLIGDK